MHDKFSLCPVIRRREMVASHRALARTLIGRYGSSGGESSSTEDVLFDDEPPACPVGCRPAPRSSVRAFSAEQVEAALSLMEEHRLAALQKRDFTAFGGQRRSWQQLAQGVVACLAGRLLRVESLCDTRDDAVLLHARLEARRALGVRTPRDTQQAIGLVHKASETLCELQSLRDGDGLRDLDGAIGRASVMRQRWKLLAALAPGVAAQTSRMESLLRSGLEAVATRRDAREGSRALARRALLGVAGRGPEGGAAQGERVAWDD